MHLLRSQTSLQCSPHLQELLGYDEMDLRAYPDVIQFFRTLSNASKNTKYVYLLLRAKPDTCLSEEELARRVFYVGQTRNYRTRLDWYDRMLQKRRDQLNKPQVSTHAIFVESI